jgi:hypothetical protein
VQPEEELEEFDMGWLGDFIDRLSDFDREMNKVVVDSGILTGLKRGEMTEVGSKSECFAVVYLFGKYSLVVMEKMISPVSSA